MSLIRNNNFLKNRKWVTNKEPQKNLTKIIFFSKKSKIALDFALDAKFKKKKHLEMHQYVLYTFIESNYTDNDILSRKTK